MDNVFPKEGMLSINGKEIGIVRTDGRIITLPLLPQTIEFTAQHDPKIFEGVFHPAVDCTEIRARILRKGE